MFETTRYSGFLPVNPGLSLEARVPATEELVFEEMFTEALSDASSEILGSAPEVANSWDAWPSGGGLNRPAAANKGNASSVASIVGTEAYSRPVRAASAYREAIGGVSATAEPPEHSPGRHRFVEWMDGHALTRSVHACAKFVRKALEAAGVSTADRPATGAAGDYGPYLLRHGAQQLEVNEGYRPEAGDTAVFAKTTEHPFGHIQVFDGEQWVSDFRQRNFSPYLDHASTPAVKVYRLP